MIRHYQNYYWKKGKPYGKAEADPTTSEVSYKIVPDPYHRRFTIEKYAFGHFREIIYDSFLLDFRHLHSIDQAAWQKVKLEGDPLASKYLLINQDDRAVLIETYLFENNVCRSCQIQSVHGLPIATNQMYYETLGDLFNGIILYDNEKRPVLIKKYEVDAISGEFSNLLSEQLDMNQS
jgi:hypothetical protein